MGAVKTRYKCTVCEHVVIKWQGKCDVCGNWNTFEEEIIPRTKPANSTASRKRIVPAMKAMKLKNVIATDNERIVIKNEEFNRVMGGGIVKDSVNILTAPPGSGKSTLLLQISQELAELGYRVYYVSGEESITQIKSRANRIIPELSDLIWIKSETNMENIEFDIDEIDPDIIIVDSIQTVYTEELSSRAGSPTQVSECTSRLIELAKNPNRKRAVFMVSQMNKEDELVGERTLEHAVDAVLYLEGDRTQQLRILTSKKNRFGETGEVGLLSMESNGLIPIKNPSEFFMTKREKPVPGSALTVTREGSRNIVVEIESLVEKSMYGYPTRVGEGINKQQIQILCGTIERRGGLSVSDKDVYVKVVAGLKPQETAVSLGVAMSIISSIKNVGIDTNTVFIGEVGLTGEIKTVPYIDSRIKELDRLGFQRVFIPKGNSRGDIKTDNLEVIEVATLNEVISKVYASPQLLQGSNAKGKRSSKILVK